MTTPICNRLQF